MCSLVDVCSTKSFPWEDVPRIHGPLECTGRLVFSQTFREQACQTVKTLLCNIFYGQLDVIGKNLLFRLRR